LLVPKEKPMKQLLDRLVLVLALFAGGASVQAQNDRVPDSRRPPSAENGRYDPDPRFPRKEGATQTPDQPNDQGAATRSGRLTPEERQTLRRQIDEAGHDLYKKHKH
jgi:hypothetical protein